MKGAIQIAKFAQIPVFIHWSFSLILGWIAYLCIQEGADWVISLWLATFAAAVFTCVVLHEYGHALMARRFGVQTRDIILLPMGGLARLESLPQNPIEEFYIAIAGPMVNIAIAIMLSPYLWISDFGLADFQLLFSENNAELQIYSPFQFLIPLLIGTNLMLAFFNMLPAFPMDGGRVFRALLTLALGRLKATQIAATLGQIIALIFMAAGVYFRHPIIPLVGVFVFLAAMYEYRNIKISETNRNNDPIVPDIVPKELNHLST